uniref:Ubiquitin carboxyl-terminal hydrolase n=1 Tax=Parastrongyloides trichosuri TaxID=131310 RepID=A0A0N4ZNJ6_PARTI
MSDMQLENVVSIPDGIIDGKSISVCSSQDKVFKDECMYCFKTPFSDGGLFVCLKTFVGFCLEHVKEYVNRQSKYIFLNIIKKTVEKEIQEPLEKISKLAIGIAGGVGVDNNEVITEYYLAIIQDSTIKLVRMESISDSTILASMESAIRNDGVKLQERINAGVSEWDGEARILTKHANIEQVNNGKIIPNSGWVCEVDGCDLNENLWLNLVDGTIRCGRSQYIKEGVITKGNNHMKEYYETTKYPLVLKLGTIKDGDGDLYSYDEDENVFDPNLSKHLAHFGIDINKVEKTEKSTLEMELDMNQQWEWSKCQEGGVALENVYGPNFTGMINIGSSCYMNSVIQMLCISKRFKECFFDNASEILYTPLPQDTHNDVYCQFVKVFTSLLSGKFSNSNGQDQGIRPTQFRKIMGKGHPEFSTSKQQDAEEYLRHIFEVIEKGRNLPLNPVKDFQMNLETRLEDGASGRVKYSNRDEVIISLPIPLDKTEEIFNDDTQTRRKKVKLNDCIEAAFGKDVISGFKSPVTKEQTNAYNSIKLNNMPNYILFQARKFEITPEFTIRKMDIDIDVCENINLEKFRAKGKSPEEELLPEDCGGDDECNQDILHNLLDMGFSENACKRACVAVKNSNVGEAATWLMEHMDDRDINDPIVNTSSKNGLKQFDENIISQLTSLGFSSYQANYALNQTGSDDVNQAAEWLFINNESIPPPPSSISSSSTTNNVDNKKEYDDGEGNYKLVAFISHMGTSPHSGHYVVHIKRDSTWYIYNDEKVAVSQNPPFSLGYIYMFKRI